MIEPKIYTRAELVERTGVDEDALIFWLRKNLLESEVTDSRKHKRFRLAELRLVRVLMCLRRFGINVKHMEAVLQLLRTLERMGEELPTTVRFAQVLDAVDEGVSRADFENSLRQWDVDESVSKDVLRTFILISDEISQQKGSVEAWRNYLAYAERVPMGISVSDNDVAWMQFITSMNQFNVDAMLILDLKSIYAELEE